MERRSVLFSVFECLMVVLCANTNTWARTYCNKLRACYAPAKSVLQTITPQHFPSIISHNSAKLCLPPCGVVSGGKVISV